MVQATTFIILLSLITILISIILIVMRLTQQAEEDVMNRALNEESDSSIKPQGEFTQLGKEVTYPVKTLLPFNKRWYIKEVEKDTVTFSSVDKSSSLKLKGVAEGTSVTIEGYKYEITKSPTNNTEISMKVFKNTDYSNKD